MTPEQHLHQMVGALVVRNAFLMARVEALEAELAALKTPPPEP